jgi:hypothetical protein
MILSGETEELGENPVPVPCAHHKYHMDWPWRELGTPQWEAGN